MNYKLRIKKSKNTGRKALSEAKGYTIIETMIAISLFTIIVISGMGALMSANAIHQKSQGMRSIMDNLSFITEDISRNLRTGSKYHCLEDTEAFPVFANVLSNPKSCDGGGWAIAFEPPRGTSSFGDQWVYYISNDGEGNGKIFKAVEGPYEGENFVQLTPDEVVIDSEASSFTVFGAESPTTTADLRQPFAIIRLVGTITYREDIVTPFSIQTAVSQRQVDI